MMTHSLIVTTYNWSDALNRVIESALSQTCLPNEILIADDGSDENTAEVVNRLSSKSSVPINHIWHADRGFRAAMIRNKAIAASASEYIILIDGDMVLEKHFIQDHLQAAEKQHFIQGGRVVLDHEASVRVIADQNSTFSIFQKGLGNRKNCIRSKLLSKIFSYNKSSLNGIRTCNFSFWKQDAIDVNGFNEDFTGWGREDSEFAARLLHNGIIRKNLRFNATAYHLFHPFQEREMLPQNDLLLANTIENKLIRCENGIDKYQSLT